MEENKKWGASAFPSLKESLSALGGNRYGEETLHLNAALAMFLSAPPEERERWIGIVQRAKRVRNGKSILENIQEITAGAASKPTHLWPGVPNPIGEIVDEVARDLSDVKPDRPPSAPARGAGKAKR